MPSYLAAGRCKPFLLVLEVTPFGKKGGKKEPFGKNLSQQLLKGAGNCEQGTGFGCVIVSFPGVY